MGSGSAIATVASDAYMMDAVSKFPLHKGKLLGTFHATSSLAYVIGPAIGGMLAERGGMGLPFVLLGSAILATAPLYALLPETRPATASISSIRLGPAFVDAKRSFAELLSDKNQQV